MRDFFFSRSETKRINQLSDTYPGFKSEFDAYIFTMRIDQHNFNPGGYKEIQEDKTTYFTWIKQ